MRVILFSVITPGFLIVLQSLPHSVTLFHCFFSHFLMMKFGIRVHFLSLSAPHTLFFLISALVYFLPTSTSFHFGYCFVFPFSLVFHPHFLARFVVSTVDHSSSVHFVCFMLWSHLLPHWLEYNSRPFTSNIPHAISANSHTNIPKYHTHTQGLTV